MITEHILKELCKPYYAEFRWIDRCYGFVIYIYDVVHDNNCVVMLCFENLNMNKEDFKICIIKPMMAALKEE